MGSVTDVTHDVDVDLVHFQWPVQPAIKHWIICEDFILQEMCSFLVRVPH